MSIHSFPVNFRGSMLRGRMMSTVSPSSKMVSRRGGLICLDVDIFCSVRAALKRYIPTRIAECLYLSVRDNGARPLMGGRTLAAPSRRRIFSLGSRFLKYEKSSSSTITRLIVLRGMLLSIFLSFFFFSLPVGLCYAFPSFFYLLICLSDACVCAC